MDERIAAIERRRGEMIQLLRDATLAEHEEGGDREVHPTDPRALEQAIDPLGAVVER